MTQTVLVAGATGKFGARAAEAFAAAGWTVRRFRRGTDMAQAAAGADVILNALNPPNYHDWDRLVPAITAEVIAAAKASGATVIFPGNVYVYGDQPGPWSVATPHRPVARKGRIRAEMVETYRRAAADDGVRSICLCAGDFIDAENPQSLFRIVTLKHLAQGRITAMGAPEVVRAYAYLPDLARAAVGLAEQRAELPAFAEVMFPGVAFSMDELAAIIGGMTGQRPRIGRFAWWMMTLAAPFWEMARELREMRYLYETPHRLDGGQFATLLPEFRMTPLDRIVAGHLAPSGQVDVHPDKAMA